MLETETSDIRLDRSRRGLYAYVSQGNQLMTKAPLEICDLQIDMSGTKEGERSGAAG